MIGKGMNENRLNLDKNIFITYTISLFPFFKNYKTNIHWLTANKKNVNDKS